VNAIVIYESLTGNTRKAAGLIGRELTAAGVPTSVCSITAIDYQALAEADLVIIGTWTDGIIVAGQRPGRAGRLRKLPTLYGKKAAVYVTYAIDQGRVLSKLSDIVAGRGADVLGGMAIKRNDIEGGVAIFVDRLLNVVPA
jgi:hypothetical protein